MTVLLAIALAATLFFVGLTLWIAFNHRRWLVWHRRAGRRPAPLGLRGWLRLYADTHASVLTIFGWKFLAAFRDGLRVPDGATGPPVLCVHGFLMNGTCMWGIRRELERRGRPTRSVFLGLPYRRPEAYSRRLAEVLSELAAAFPGEGVDLVAHSMGGLIVRLALAEEPELAARVRRVVTLASPHHGTAYLRWLRTGPVWSMMSREAPFLRRLPDLAETAPRARVTTFASEHDLVVYPVETAHLPGSHAVTLKGVGHGAFLTDPRVIARAADEIVGPE